MVSFCGSVAAGKGNLSKQVELLYLDPGVDCL
jgi:hypothetical protein